MFDGEIAYIELLYLADKKTKLTTIVIKIKIFQNFVFYVFRVH